MQKLVCIYLKAKGVPKSCFFFFRKAGLTLGYQWSVNALVNISAAAMAKAALLFEAQPCIIIHDNIRLPFPVKHQRGNNMTTTDNGTAMTIVPLHDSLRAIAVLRNSEVLEQHWTRITSLYRQNRMPQFAGDHIFELVGFQTWGKRMVSDLLDFLFAVPGLEKSSKRKHKLLAPMEPVHQLPYGPDHVTRFYMLESMPMEEQTYGGNYAITKEVP